MSLDSGICFYCGTPFPEEYGCDFCNKPTHPKKVSGPMGEFRPEDTGVVVAEETVKFVGPVRNPDGSIFIGDGKPIPPHQDCSCSMCKR